MNKKTVWWIVGVAVVIIVAVVIWWGAKPAKAPEVGSNTPAATGTVPTSANASGTATPSATVVASGTPGMTVTMGGVYSGNSYSFKYPFAWTIESYRPFVMTTFGGKYINNDVIPPGGAEIDIATTTVYGNLQAIMQTELMTATNITTSAVAVDGTSCAEASYHNTYSGGVASKDIAVYCVRGNELWKFYLSYRADDPAGSTHVADFNSVLASMKLL